MSLPPPRHWPAARSQGAVERKAGQWWGPSAMADGPHGDVDTVSAFEDRA